MLQATLSSANVTSLPTNEDSNMGQSKDQIIAATGGLLANPIERQRRERFAELRGIMSKRNLSEAELAEFKRIHDWLPDDDEHSYLDKD